MINDIVFLNEIRYYKFVMLSYLIGRITNKYNNKITVLTAAGVGYEVNLPMFLFLELKMNQEVELNVYLAVRENSLDLFGFKNLEQKDLFMKFLSVNGIGPKSALHLLSLGTVEEISSAIARGDVAYLTKVSGVGKKTAERIVVELKSKVQSSEFRVQTSEMSESLGEVVDALTSLGYSKDEAREVVRGLKGEKKSSEILLKEALKILSKY